MNELRTKAEAGQPLAQTLLADCYLAAAEFTNAVAWYRRAAEQGHIPAQLSLAACLVAGRGVSKDPAEAARLLRASADLLEKRAGAKAAPPGQGPAVSGPVTNQALTTPVQRTIVAFSKLPTNPPGSAPATSMEGTSRVARVQILQAAEPELQTGGSGTPKRPDPH